MENSACSFDGFISSSSENANETRTRPKNEECFEQLYRYYQRVYVYLARAGVSESDARDVAQDIFVRVYQSLDSYRGGAAWPYLKTVAHRALCNYVRSRHASKRRTLELSLDDPYVDADVLASSTPETDLLEKENLEYQQHALNRMRAAITRLPQATASCVLLRLAGHDYTAISKQLRITPSAVKARLHDARAYLSKALMENRLSDDPATDQSRERREPPCFRRLSLDSELPLIVVTKSRVGADYDHDDDASAAA